MSAPFSTLCLDLSNWDLFPDASGNIALAAPPYAVAQDVASAIKTFLADCYYNQALGIPYFAQILGHTPPLSIFQGYLQDAALTVPSVISAQCVIESINARTVQGYVQFTDSANVTQSVAL
jgi:hypothetical protein